MKKVTMFKRVLLLLLLITVLVVPGMAYDYSESPSVVIYGWANQLAPSTGGVGSGAGGYAFDTLRVRHIESFADVTMLRISGDARAYDIPYDSQSFSVDLIIGSTVIGHGTYGTFRSGSHDVIWVTIDSPLNVGGYSGIQTIKLVKSAGETGTFATGSNIPGIVYSWRDYRKDSTTYKFKWDSSVSWDKPGYEWAFYRSVDTSFEVYGTAPHEVYYETDWWCSYTFDESLHGMYQFELNRPQGAYVYITDRLNELRYVDDTLRFSDVSIFLDNAPFTVSVSPNLVNWVNQTHYKSMETTVPVRTGTVTMTDNNGTTITGFEVTAVNAYTNEEHTVTTETDVAIMNLPMERTIEIRNPQTGVYEEAPIGYYRFYGQSSGYKMLNEGGIQVSVMPEKYGSYQLCDIRVTQESGYLTGKHQFQIRSRSDNSILQSGTISAKSATTGEWYNTTVTNGIASLILPYDTSNSISQYAGNYYVYATSPGFVDSDYGTQIVVMPHTVSEIKDIHLTPIGGIPTHGNVTLRIQAFSETGPGVVNAEIFIAGVQGAGASVWDTYTASSTGYLTVSVPGNSTYDIVASGTGYYDSARRVEVFMEDPPLIEIKLYLSSAPTVEPTTQPTGWVTEEPTQTTPPIQEDNIIGLSVKGLAKGFGIDYDTALLLFGLMIVFGAGGIVMNSVKGGAMEFIAGSIVGTFVAFALGLIPIWIFIIIAVVFGAYVLRVFIQGGQ